MYVTMRVGPVESYITNIMTTTTIIDIVVIVLHLLPTPICSMCVFHHCQYVSHIFCYHIFPFLG